MPIIRLKELRPMSKEERTKKLQELRAELSRLRTMVSAGGAVENPTRIREIRRTIAQVLTIENEDRLGIRKPAKETKKKQNVPKAKKPEEKKVK